MIKRNPNIILGDSAIKFAFHGEMRRNQSNRLKTSGTVAVNTRKPPVMPINSEMTLCRTSLLKLIGMPLNRLSNS